MLDTSEYIMPDKPVFVPSEATKVITQALKVSIDRKPDAILERAMVMVVEKVDTQSQETSYQTHKISQLEAKLVTVETIATEGRDQARTTNGRVTKLEIVNEEELKTKKIVEEFGLSDFLSKKTSVPPKVVNWFIGIVVVGILSLATTVGTLVYTHLVFLSTLNEAKIIEIVKTNQQGQTTTTTTTTSPSAIPTPKKAP